MAQVIFACSANRNYARNRVLTRALQRSHDVEIVASSASSYPARLGSVLPRILLTGGRFDVYFAGFLGQPLMPFLRLSRASPIVLDAFVSVYDTLCLDRGTFGPRSPIGRVARWLDVRSLSWAKRILTDTPQQANFLAAEFGVPLSKFVPIPVGADESLFYPRPDRASEGVGVLYYSTYLPLHGAHVVIEAARLLDGRSDVSFTLIGNGPERARVEGLAKEYRLTNCTFIDWMAPESLSDYIAGCDSFLGGHFNAESAKARRVVPGKVYQGLAMAKPVVVGDCEAGREWFQHGENAYVVPMGDPEALADAILELSGSARLRGRIGKGGRALYQEHFSEAAIAARLDECIAAVLGSR